VISDMTVRQQHWWGTVNMVSDRMMALREQHSGRVQIIGGNLGKDLLYWSKGGIRIHDYVDQLLTEVKFNRKEAKFERLLGVSFDDTTRIPGLCR
jgi:hypothetical protein